MVKYIKFTQSPDPFSNTSFHVIFVAVEFTCLSRTIHTLIVVRMYCCPLNVDTAVASCTSASPFMIFAVPVAICAAMHVIVPLMYFTVILFPMRLLASVPDPTPFNRSFVNLSDPPYYTACPNPWLNDFIELWEKEKETIPGRVKDFHIDGIS